MNDALTFGLIFSGTSLGLILLVSGLSYRLGYWKASGIRSPRFDRLVPSLRLHQTTWRAKFSRCGSNEEEDARCVTLTFRQAGSRLTAEGEDENGRRWSLEGVVFYRHVTFLTLERSAAGHALGSGHFEVAEPLVMLGTHSSTSHVAGCVLIRTLRLEQVVPEPEDAVVDEDLTESASVLTAVHS